ARDLTQETFLRAWNKRESFEGRAALRTWLYRIATNACLDFLDKRDDRTPVPSGLPDAGSEVLHLQPFPDPMLPEDPQESAVARETIELAFIVAVQHLPPRQRAVFVLRDVLGWRATTVADALELTVASVTSALQRARGPALRDAARPGHRDHDGEGRGGRLGLRWALPARPRRLAWHHHGRQPHARRRALPPRPRRTGAPVVRRRGPARRGRQDRRAHRL